MQFHTGPLKVTEQELISDGFARHNKEQDAPAYHKARLNWLAYDGKTLVGALTADMLWDWLYIDELWVGESHRGSGLGKSLSLEAEAYARKHSLTGIWLWTQDWQAADFYRHMGYKVFARFPNFPKGHVRIGFRKLLD